MKKYIHLPIYLLILIIHTSCVSTTIISSWKEQNKQIEIGKLHKVLVVALFKDETNRRKAEDQMVIYLKGKGIVSYNYLDDNISAKNEEAIRDKIKTDGFDGAITMRLIDVDKEKTYTPGNITSYPSYYQTFGGYYYRNWNYYRTPGYYSTTKTYTIETNVFSIKEDKIIWTGITQTTNPEGVNKLTEEVTKVVYKKMVSEGFINK
ncbi:MAG: hypothetical protein IPF58_14470 [Saprospirales bacterium]|nr:hypothetical protein [Saprospirales bacterium]